MSGYYLKPPGAALDYTIDWASAYLAPSETLEADLGWSVTPDEPDAGGLVLVSNSLDGGATTARVSGGRLGSSYRLSSKIRTSLGRIDERAVLIRVGQR